MSAIRAACAVPCRACRCSRPGAGCSRNHNSTPSGSARSSARSRARPAATRPPPLEPLSDSEIRVLRYLPTNLPVPQIAGELSVSVHTIKTHTKHLYATLGTHTRAEAVDRARALGLLAPSPHRGQATRAG